MRVEEKGLPCRGAGAGADLLVHAIDYGVIEWVERDGRVVAPALGALIRVKVAGKRVITLVDQGTGSYGAAAV